MENPKTKKQLEKMGWDFFTHSGGAVYASKRLSQRKFTAKTLPTLRKKITDYENNKPRQYEHY